jgi:hypothetical protein
VRESLRRFVQRPHRLVGPPVVDLSGVTWVTYANPTVPLPGQSAAPSTVTLPNAPLDPAIRQPESDFLWQRGPFEPASPNSGDPAEENTGLCLVQPYWMGRFHGVGF